MGCTASFGTMPIDEKGVVVEFGVADIFALVSPLRYPSHFMIAGVQAVVFFNANEFRRIDVGMARPDGHELVIGQVGRRFKQKLASFLIRVQKSRTFVGTMRCNVGIELVPREQHSAMSKKER